MAHSMDANKIVVTENTLKRETAEEFKRIEEDNTEPDDDSSFETLSCPDENDDFQNSVYSSALENSVFEILNGAYLADPFKDKTDFDNPEMQANENLAISTNFKHQVTPYFELSKKYIQDPEFSTHQLHISENLPPEQNCISDRSFKELNNSFLSDIVKSYNLASPATTEYIDTSTCESNVTPEAFDVLSLWDKSVQTSMDDNFDNCSLSLTQSMLIADPLVPTEGQRIYQSECQINVQDVEDDSGRRQTAGSLENDAIPNSTERSSCERKLCTVLKHTMRVFRWFRSNVHIQKFLQGAQASFANFLNTFEMEMNEILGTNNPLQVIVVSGDMDCTVAIEAAFCKTFDRPVLITRIAEKPDSTIPVLPIGYTSALQAAQTKIHNARQECNSKKDAVMLSTARFITESIPQRWQMASVLCLEDPIIKLYLHNFSVTIPIPNEYVSEAQKLTPDDYPLKNQGLAVTLKDAVDYVMKIKSEDTQELLTGVNHYATLKSAAEVLAGMYNKYISSIIQ